MAQTLNNSEKPPGVNPEERKVNQVALLKMETLLNSITLKKATEVHFKAKVIENQNSKEIGPDDDEVISTLLEKDEPLFLEQKTIIKRLQQVSIMNQFLNGTLNIPPPPPQDGGTDIFSNFYEQLTKYMEDLLKWNMVSTQNINKYDLLHSEILMKRQEVLKRQIALKENLSTKKAEESHFPPEYLKLKELLTTKIEKINLMKMLIINLIVGSRINLLKQSHYASFLVKHGKCLNMDYYQEVLSSDEE